MKRFPLAGLLTIAFLACPLVCTTSVVNAGDISHQNESSLCLRGTSVGDTDKPAAICANYLNLKFFDQMQYARAGQLLEIEKLDIEFKGCKDFIFSAAPKYDKNNEGGYFITHSLVAEEKYFAPIVHELVHIMQIDLYGGIKELKSNLSILRIELSADYLTGVIFRKLGVKKNEFQHSIELIGRYEEEVEDAHGTPSQRTAAFRFGYYDALKNNGKNLREFHRFFQDDIFGKVMEM